jgi:hypothetical protein
MAPLFHVKVRLLAAALVCAAGIAFADETPDAAAILKTVRVAQAAQERSLNGRLRTGAKSIPFKLSVAANTVRWDFTDPPQTLLLRLGEKEARLEESGKGGTTKVTAARFDDKVRDSDISYEDLSMRFLYWTNAKVEGEQTMLLQKCWIVRVEPPAKSDSQYSAVKLWIAKNNGALLQAEAMGADGRLARRFKVISGHSLGDGLWILKQMRIEAPTTIGGRTQDRTPTYLEIDAPER